MEAVVPVLVLAQASVAGLLIGLALLNVLWWRSDRRTNEARCLAGWCAALATLFALNAVVPLAHGTTSEVLLFLRSQAIAASVVLIVPVLRSTLAGPRARGVVIALTAIYVVRAGLWLTTDLVYAHSIVENVPQYGPMLALSSAVPVSIVFGYVVLVAVRGPRSARHRTLVLTALVCVGVLGGSYFFPTSQGREVLTSLWSLPLVALLHADAVRRLNADDARARRLRAMRDAVASLSNAAWFDRTPDALLARAENDARALLGDPEITGYVRRLNRGTFHTSFRTSPGLRQDPAAATFLDDLGHVISAAADRHELAEELERAALRDALTGLPNRRALDLHLAECLEAPATDRLVVIFCDLEGFKNINDEYGHPWGDDVLVHTGRQLLETIGDDGFVARFGGDEFVVVLRGDRSDADLEDLGGRLRQSSVAIPAAHRRALSIGIAVREPGEIREAHTLLRDADTAMYAAKHSLTGVRLFDAELRQRVLADITLRREIQAGFDSGQFEPWYQPIVDTATLEVVGLETLLRWPHPSGDRGPLEWIHEAEDSGIIVPLGLATITSAREASESSALPVSVNVAARQLAEPELTDQIIEAWGDHALDQLVLEITESALLDDVARALTTLRSLRERGVRIAIDDFGTGYSSLARLAQLPIDIIKIDQEFVRGVTLPRGEKVLKAVLDLAAAHGLDVVVEGVETAAELAVLRRLGVPKVQGFLLARPCALPMTTVDLDGLGAAGVITAAD